MFYSKIVDSFISEVKPLHLDDDNWNRTFLKHHVEPGAFIFINKGQYFKKLHEDTENAEVGVQAFKKNVKIEYMINTRDMYGTTSIAVSFSGHRSCASFLQVKSIGDDGKDRVLHCTPFALGVGFAKATPS